MLQNVLLVGLNVCYILADMNDVLASRKGVPTMTKTLQFTFHVLIEETEGVHVANCLELGLVATADTREDLPSIMAKMITRQVQFALSNNNFDDIYHPAPAAVWQKFQNALAQEGTEEIEQTQRGIAPWLAFKLNSYVGAEA